MKLFFSVVLTILAFVVVGIMSCQTMAREDAAHHQKGQR